MAYFPFFIDLKDKKGLILGSGRHTYEKVLKLLPYGPALTVVDPLIDEKIKSLDNVFCIERKCVESDFDGCLFVIATCADQTERDRAAAICTEKHILFNSEDDTANCEFYFPSLVKSGDLSIGISTGGVCPTAAVWMREKIEALLPKNIGEAISLTRKRRDELKKVNTKHAEVRRLLREYFLSLIDADK